MNPLKVFMTPEYLFRPKQILTRLKRSIVKPKGDQETIILPWKSPLRIRPQEVIGANIWYYGIFDLIVAEAITRLLDRGETAADIGANIGQMTSLMSYVVGAEGQVHSFEPHPEVFAELSGNVALSKDLPLRGPVALHAIALSDHAGQGLLATPSDWEENRGKARVASSEPSDQEPKGLGITLDTFDHVLEAQSIGLCKIDVEGHELAVFQGAEKALKDGRIRDVVFEDLDPFPSPVHEKLLQSGYSLFSLWTKTMRPVLSPVQDQSDIPTTRDGSNYLATLDPDRARNRFLPAGWSVFKQ